MKSKCKNEENGTNANKMDNISVKDYNNLCRELMISAQDLWDKYGEPTWSDMPKIEEIKKKIKIHDDYVNYIEKYYLTENKMPEKGIDILPPWYAFPDYGTMTIGWRMGIGEDYRYYYWDYYNTLSLQEKTEHLKKYPRPFYMDYEMMFNDTNSADEDEDEDKKEKVIYKFFDKNKNEEKIIHASYFVFYDLSDEEKQIEIERVKRGLASNISGEIVANEKNKDDDSYEEENMNAYYNKFIEFYKEIKKNLEFRGWEKVEN